MVLATGYNATDALVALQDLTQWTVEPQLSAAELQRLLRQAVAPDEDGNDPDAWPSWVALTAYPLDYRVVPATRNGYVYIVTTAGTSGASAPSFDTDIDDTTVDGTVTWTTEDTAPWTPTYSTSGLYRAALLGWETKYRKLTAGETFSADGASFNPEARRKDIRAEIDALRRKCAGSFALTGRTSRIENWENVGSLSVNG
jgi:hypothetical protein